MAYPEPFKADPEKLFIGTMALIGMLILWGIFSLLSIASRGPDPFGPIVFAIVFYILLDYSVQKLCWQLSKWAAKCPKYCHALIAGCSAVMVALWVGTGAAAAVEDNLGIRLLVVPLIFFYICLYYCRNAAKLALREKEPPLSLNSPLNRRSCRTISAICFIILVVICVAWYYLHVSDPIIPLPASLLAIGYLHIVFMDLVDDIRPLLVRFNGLLRIILHALIMIILIASIRSTMPANHEKISIPWLLIRSVTTFALLMLNHQIGAAKIEQDAKILARDGPSKLPSIREADQQEAEEEEQWCIEEAPEKQPLIFTLDPSDDLAKSGQ